VDFSLKHTTAGTINRTPEMVSILVLVDFSLKLPKGGFQLESRSRFNPCFGGFFSKTLFRESHKNGSLCFNPCFGGFFSKTHFRNDFIQVQPMFQSLFWWIFL